MPSTDSRSDPLLEKFIQYYKHRAQPGFNDSVFALYNSIEDKKWLEIVLSKYKEATPPNIDRPNISSYKYSIPAGALVECFFFVINLNLWATGIGKTFQGPAYGAGVPSISGSGGTLFYNNASDFTGSCDVECFFVSASATFFSCTQEPGTSLLPMPAVVSQCLGISMATARGADE